MVAHKRFTVHEPPPVLSVHFKRFDFTYRHGAKITRHVEFDETLDLAPYMSDSSKPVLYKCVPALGEDLCCGARAFFLIVRRFDLLLRS